MHNCSLKSISFLIAVSILLISCHSSPTKEWNRAVPPETSFIVIPDTGATIGSVTHATYIPFLKNITASDFSLVSKIDSSASASLAVRSILLYPGTQQRLQPIWITDAPKNFQKRLLNQFGHQFAQNKYIFHDVTILNLQFNRRHIFATTLGNFMFISESSLGIEQAIRSYKELQPTADLTDVKIVPASLVMNTPALDKWISRMARVQYHPMIENFLKDTRPGSFSVSQQGNSARHQLQMNGSFALTDDEQTPLVEAISQKNEAVTLDQYVSADASAFAIFHAPPPALNPESLPDTSTTDSYFIDNPKVYQQISKTLDEEFGMVMYDRSGFLNKGEYLFMRKVKDPARLQQELKNLSNNSNINRQDSLFFAQSSALGQLLGSKLCNFQNFYIKVIGQAVIITKRKGLAQLVVSSRQRKRLVTFEPYYQKMTRKMNAKSSSIFVSGPNFSDFLQPLLTANSYISAVTSPFQYIALTTRVNDTRDKISVHISTFNEGQTQKAYRERWVYSVQGADLSGRPVFGNIDSGYNKEIVFATKNGTVDALSADGTLKQQFNTGSDTPVGSPVVYDWYGTGQKVILIAAGNKVYGWDKNGSLLPQFPFRFDEQITTPLSVADINHNKSPNAIVGTADRNVHVLNGRGDDLQGWPVKTNAAVTADPLIDYYHGKSSVIVFSSNAVHGWDASGAPLPGFPHFIDAEFIGAPSKYKSTVLGGAVNGNLYAIGDRIPFDDSKNVYKSNAGATDVKAIGVSGSALSGTPVIQDNKIMISDRNGSIYVMDTEGNLKFTRNMGPSGASGGFTSITDINASGDDDIIAVADYGRLYAWRLSDGNEIENLPSAAMQHVSIADIDGDGLKEVVGQTGEGIQCWTINRQ